MAKQNKVENGVNKSDEFRSMELKHEVTPRLVLQKFGTECMRDGFHDGIWVSLVKKKLKDNPRLIG